VRYYWILFLGIGLLLWTAAAPSRVVMAPANQVDLAVGLEPPVNVVHPGDRVFFSLRVENFSRVQARNVAVTFSIPQGLQQEAMYSNGVWDNCTVLDTSWPAPRVTCIKHYFDPGFTTITIPVRVPANAATWPYPLTVWAGVGNDLKDYDTGNNHFEYTLTVQ
jgi:uncharacterized repeat protein (TIGR01451 family)